MSVPVIRALPTGSTIDFNNLDALEISIEEVATLLDKVMRFNGFGWSVTRHSLLVAHCIYAATLNPFYALHGLLHDAHEALTGDISSPVKEMVGSGLKSFEEAVQVALISNMIGRLSVERMNDKYSQAVVKFFDQLALQVEVDDLFSQGYFKTNYLDFQADWLEVPTGSVEMLVPEHIVADVVRDGSFNMAADFLSFFEFLALEMSIFRAKRRKDGVTFVFGEDAKFYTITSLMTAFEDFLEKRGKA